MKKTILMIVLVCWAVAMVRAQKTCVIANAEDHVPVREALIHTDNNHWARTDYRGYWTMKYQFDETGLSEDYHLSEESPRYGVSAAAESPTQRGGSMGREYAWHQGHSERCAPAG